MYPM